MQNFAGSAADQNLIRLQLFACGDGGTELLGIFVMIAAGASQHLSHGVDRKLGRSIGILVGVQQYKLAQVPAPGAALRVGSFASNGQASGYQSKSTCEIAASQHEASWFRMIPQEGPLPSRGALAKPQLVSGQGRTRSKPVASGSERIEKDRSLGEGHSQSFSLS